MYVVISGSEDGTRFFTCKSAKELQEHLTESGIRNFRKDMKDMDTNYWGEDEALILNASLIVPKAVKVVDAWTFE